MRIIELKPVSLKQCLLWFCYNPQANVDGVTGNVQFDEGGTRNGIEFDIYNLRNNSFQVVSNEDFGYLELISFPKGTSVFSSFSQVFYNARICDFDSFILVM